MTVITFLTNSFAASPAYHLTGLADPDFPQLPVYHEPITHHLWQRSIRDYLDCAGRFLLEITELVHNPLTRACTQKKGGPDEFLMRRSELPR